MSGFQLVASLVRSLAWPIALVAVILIMRPQLANLLSGALRRLKAGPIELEIGDQLAEVQSELSESVDPTQVHEEEIHLIKMLSLLVSHDPVAGVIRAFIYVESALGELLRRSGLDPTRWRARPLTAKIDAAKDAGLISEQQAGVINALRHLRNVVTHSSAPVSMKEAREYVALAGIMLSALTDSDSTQTE